MSYQYDTEILSQLLLGNHLNETDLKRAKSLLALLEVELEQRVV